MSEGVRHWRPMSLGTACFSPRSWVHHTEGGDGLHVDNRADGEEALSSGIDRHAVTRGVGEESGLDRERRPSARRRFDCCRAGSCAENPDFAVFAGNIHLWTPPSNPPEGVLSDLPPFGTGQLESSHLQSRLAPKGVHQAKAVDLTELSTIASAKCPHGLPNPRYLGTHGHQSEQVQTRDPHLL